MTENKKLNEVELVVVDTNVAVEEVDATSQAAVSAPAAPAPTPAPAPAPSAGEGEKVTAPMPGTILDVKVAVGDSVSKGQVIMILEAMKMENEVVAPQDGTIASINVAAGDSVEAGAVLASLN